MPRDPRSAKKRSYEVRLQDFGRLDNCFVPRGYTTTVTTTVTKNSRARWNRTSSFQSLRRVIVMVFFGGRLGASHLSQQNLLKLANYSKSNCQPEEMGDKKGLLRLLHIPFQCHHAPKTWSDSTTPPLYSIILRCFFWGGSLEDTSFHHGAMTYTQTP